MRLSWDSVAPVYTASSVAKPEPLVEKVTGPVAGGRQTYQTEWPPALPLWFGSPASFVAESVVPETLPLHEPIAWADANMSFGGGDTTCHDAEAGEASTLPAASVARTRNVCKLSASPE